MSERLPARSILKQQDTRPKSTLSDEQKQKAERDRRNLGIALQHANKIQAQKDVSAAILSSIETLLDYPLSVDITAAEASEFTSVVALFQPSDFDSLVEERRIDGKCGYALCSYSPRCVTLGASAAWKLKGKGAGDYCSDDCVRKALYVKTQLSEVPAWEREPGQQPQIVLREHSRFIADPSNPSTAPARQQRNVDGNELALERGEPAHSFRPNQVMADQIVEKRSGFSKAAYSISTFDGAHSAIEGYVPASTLNHTARTEQVLPGHDEYDNPDEIVKTTMPDDEEESWKALYENLESR